MDTHLLSYESVQNNKQTSKQNIKLEMHLQNGFGFIAIAIAKQTNWMDDKWMWVDCLRNLFLKLIQVDAVAL